MAKIKPARPEPTTDSGYNTYLVPRSKTSALTELYEFLLAMKWRFDPAHVHWHTPEHWTQQAFGRLEYAPDCTQAWIQPPNQRGSLQREQPILTFVRKNDRWETT